MTPDMLHSPALWGFQKQKSLQISQSISASGGNKAGVCVCVCACVLAGSRYSQLPHHKTRGSTPVRLRLFSETLNPHMRGVCVTRGKIYDWNINSTSETETEDFTSLCTSLEKKTNTRCALAQVFRHTYMRLCQFISRFTCESQTGQSVSILVGHYSM